MAVEQALTQQRVELVRARVGDRYVLEELVRRSWQLGGEGSGHLIALDRHTTGDGVVSALQVLQAVRRRGRSLAELLEGVVLFPQVLVNVRLPADADWQRNRRLQTERSEIEAVLSGRGRVLIRPSGTEPVLRVMVEAQQQTLAQSAADRLVEAALAGAEG
jgi:phosphoglucosamine mutase